MFYLRDSSGDSPTQKGQTFKNRWLALALLRKDCFGTTVKVVSERSG